jgi:hypothetical protein
MFIFVLYSCGTWSCCEVKQVKSEEDGLLEHSTGGLIHHLDDGGGKFIKNNGQYLSTAQCYITEHSQPSLNYKH